MAITNGMVASLVNRPRMINAAQKNSAKMTSDKEAVEPTSKGSAKLLALAEKVWSLGKPCCIMINEPAPNRRRSRATLNVPSETFVLNSFFIAFL